MKNLKYIYFSLGILAFTACNDPEDVNLEPEVMAEALAELNAGSADFSTYVSLGNSLTAGFTDNALFQAGQANSFPNLLSTKFALAGGGSFSQPLMNDNIGGLLAGGSQIEGFNPRLVFGGAGPVDLSDVVGEVAPTTDIVLNNPSGPFNNMGVPGAKSFHLLAPGYGNIANLSAQLANPYFVRMTGATPDARVLELAMAQSPTFFTLWIGNNDVLGYALSGGDGTNPITDQPTFDLAINTLVTTLTSGGAKGVVANIPYVTSIPHFTTVPHDPIDPEENDFAAQVPTLNTVYGALNQVYTALGETERVVVFSDTLDNAVVIKDEALVDISAQITGAFNANPAFPVFVTQLGLPQEAAPLVASLLGTTYGQTRPATENDLLVLPSSKVIGTVNEESFAALSAANLPAAVAGQFSVEGITLPLADKWVLTPEEQDEIKIATDQFNATITSAASAAGLAFVDANQLLQDLAQGGVTDGDFTLTANLVTGGGFSLDGVHLTARGYALIANEFMKAIDATYQSNFEASGSLFNIGNFPTNYSPALQ
ncbi:G-D-S-L family lipolytic protein [Zobellia sp. 1_MG-2023]|uniref:G-D-S-L family lipolytic protein n=1 Tax=Zobellia sp. 1_MG-2023 TaxID=3062626 RepID=UPI0026E23913|nr:G-D-S-L family lipolytic protein [Zobellia sp. 1_MG-2023]MDO6817855.1 G-D-S-L family lipolytic protein [Zobellia sp. 1_MG-2023]